MHKLFLMPLTSFAKKLHHRFLIEPQMGMGMGTAMGT